MKKVCVFCGQRPLERTREHVIPQWLIRLTGNPKRFGFFGFYKENNGLKKMHLVFDQFKFPACNKCNQEFGELETSTKPFIIDLLKEYPLDCRNINLLLTWLDKVRIGLWIGSLYYNNPLGIDPNFYISQGTFTRDRMIIIYKNKIKQRCLNFLGIHYVFQMLPICFTLIINNFAIINIAKIFLLSKGFGLAIPEQEYVLTSRGSLINFKPGSQQIEYPLVNITFDRDCTEFYQPILDPPFADMILPKLDIKHRKKVFINETSGIGNIFYLKDGKLLEYTRNKTINWIPPSLDMSFLEFFRLIGMQTLEIQNHYFSEQPLMFDPKLEPEFKKQKSFALSTNKILLKRLRDRDFKEFKK